MLPATQREFRIGYAPAERYALKEFLGGKGVSVADMVEAGLLVTGDDIPVPYDRFRDRVVIPIQDQRGRVIAFGGRTLKSDVQPKYLNSPETPLFQKSHTVFNFHRARTTAQKVSMLVAVEGYLDAISVYQAGMKNVVALMGTAFTEEQVQSLWRLAPEPVICFDGDRAGRTAAERSLERILPLMRTGVSFRYAFLQDADPDEVIRRNGLDRFRSRSPTPAPSGTCCGSASSRNGRDAHARSQGDLREEADGVGRVDRRPVVTGELSQEGERPAGRPVQGARLATGDAMRRGQSFLKRELLLEPAEPLVGIEKILLGTLIDTRNSSKFSSTG